MKFFYSLLLIFLVLFSGATFGQITWDPVIDLTTPSLGKNHPRIVVDRSGDPVILWYHLNNAYVSKWDGISFTFPIKVNPNNVDVSGAYWMGPEIAAHGDTVYVVYKEKPVASDSSHIWCTRSFDGGTTFSTPVRVEYVGDSLSRFPTVTTDDLGNPIVGFMKFNPNFMYPRWVVSRSTDLGSTFSGDVLAGDWSGPNSEACDCCPGTVICNGGYVAMIYRDNNQDLRDNWAGVSNDTGSTFLGGFNYDQQNWFVPQCPASGPDGIIIGDSLYTVFMNGATGKELAYFSRSSLTSLSGGPGIPVTTGNPGVAVQNLPRIDVIGTRTALTWIEVLNGKITLPLLYSHDITDGTAFEKDTVYIGSANNCDIALNQSKVFVVWQDNSSSVVKFRSGTFGITTSASIVQSDPSISITQSNDHWMIMFDETENDMNIRLYDLSGKLIMKDLIDNSSGYYKIRNDQLDKGIYTLIIDYENGTFKQKVYRF